MLIKERPSAVVGRFPTPPGHWALFVGPSWPPPPAFEHRSAVEFQALAKIHRHFSELNDPRFATVRPIALQKLTSAFAMEEIDAVPLDRCLADEPARGNPPLAPPPLESCGAWLRHFHEMQAAAEAPVHHDTPGQILGALAELSAGLPVGFAPSEGIRELVSRTQRLIERALPETLPIGLTHGDFWTGNVLVDATGAVAVIDTFAASRTPIFEDLAYFVFQLKTEGGALQKSSQFRPSPRALERELLFLRGYFPGSEIPIETLRVFELCVLIRKWASRCHRCAAYTGARRVWKRIQLSARSRHFRAYSEWLLGPLEAGPHRRAPSSPAAREVNHGA